MPRILQIEEFNDLPEQVELLRGDVIFAYANGIRLEDDNAILEILGPMQSGLITSAGITMQQGGKLVFLAIARSSGVASLVIASGEIWSNNALKRVMISISS